MISQIKTFFKPTTQVEQYRNIVVVLSAALAICIVMMLVYGLQMQRREIGFSDSDRLGMIILSDQASRK